MSNFVKASPPVAYRAYARLKAEFGPDATNRRLKAAERMAADPEIALPFHAILLGPETLPDTAFRKAAWDRLFS
ncbi:MAG TPA: hypothetical protein VGU45_13590 [Microvirga sp.]|nr:hypothetical protein [Microvirga sp.]